MTITKLSRHNINIFYVDPFIDGLKASVLFLEGIDWTLLLKGQFLQGEARKSAGFHDGILF